MYHNLSKCYEGALIKLVEVAQSSITIEGYFRVCSFVRFFKRWNHQTDCYKILKFSLRVRTKMNNKSNIIYTITLRIIALF